MTVFSSFKVRISTAIDDTIINEASEADLRKRIGDQKFDWLQSRGHISWKVFGVSRGDETLISNCVDEASARKVASILEESIPTTTMETVLEISLNFYAKQRDLSEADKELYSESMDKVDGQRGANDLITSLSKIIEERIDQYGIEWGTDNDFYIVAGTAADAFFDEFMNDPNDIDMIKIAHKALLGEGLFEEERRSEIIQENIEEFAIDPFIMEAVENDVIAFDQAFHLKVYFDAFANKAENAYGYREFAGDREEEIINTFLSLDEKRINDWSYVEDHALNLCLELGEEAGLDPKSYGM